MSEKLTDVNGEKQIFRDTLVTNVLDIAEAFKDCNLTGDPVMARAHGDLVRTLRGVTADGLREDAGQRREVKKSIDEILRELPGIR
jgi:hypothetical protein